MARIFDVIEYPSEMKDEIVHRFPETGIGDFRIGSQVIVRESQAAVFFRDGVALDVFRAGRHTITTALQVKDGVLNRTGFLILLRTSPQGVSLFLKAFLPRQLRLHRRFRLFHLHRLSCALIL